MRPLLPLFIALLSPWAIAQGSIVSPVHFTNTEAAANNSFPFGVAVAPFRYMQIHDDLQGTPRLVKGLTLRRNAQSAANPACSVTIDVWCSTAVTTSATASATFDSNHGTNKTQVITGKIVNFPATLVGNVPTDFVFDVPFDNAFVSLGTGPLCLEVQKTAYTSTAAFYLDADSSTTANTNPPLSWVSYGTGCRISGTSLNLTATGASVTSWPTGTGIIRVTGANGPLNSFVIAFLGGSNQLAFGVPLPFLVPGTSSAPSGPCHLYASMVLITASTTTATGTSVIDFPFPATPHLNGVRTFAQILAYDPAANPTGTVLSNGVNHNIVAPHGRTPGARIYLSGSLGAGGMVTSSFLLVTRFN